MLGASPWIFKTPWGKWLTLELGHPRARWLTMELGEPPTLMLVPARVWDISSGIGPCFPLAGGLCKFYANAGGKQPVQCQLLLVQYK